MPYIMINGELYNFFFFIKLWTSNSLCLLDVTNVINMMSYPQEPISVKYDNGRTDRQTNTEHFQL